MARWGVLGCVVWILGCANHVPQDRSTGPDGKIKGAQPVALESGEGKVRGIVTYPGGDRVDWKKITLPEQQRGKLDLQVTYTTPRPGLKVTFEVFDQYNTPVTEAVAGRGRARSMSIPRAAGTYFVRIYAPRRGDAGTYQFTAAFAPAPAPLRWDPTTIVVDDPPRLPAVPDPPPTSCPVHDATNPTCIDACMPGAPATWKGCQAPPAVVQAPPVAPAPPPVAKPSPVKARVLKTEITDDGIVVTLSAGSDQGVARSWRGHLLRGETGAALPASGLQIIRVDKRSTLARVRLISEVVNANQNVILEP